MLYAFFWVIPWRLNSDVRELPRRKHKTIFKINLLKKRNKNLTYTIMK